VTGIAYIDSTRLGVCHLKRAHAHRVFCKRAPLRYLRRGKPSVGWLSGFKLPWVINDEGSSWPSSSPPATSMTGSRCRY
jgi:hypothetical protein